MSVLMRGNRSTTTDLGTQHPRKPSTPANRSKPDSLTPPNGSDWAMYVEQKSLIEVNLKFELTISDFELTIGQIELTIDLN